MRSYHQGNRARVGAQLKSRALCHKSLQNLVMTQRKRARIPMPWRGLRALRSSKNKALGAWATSSTRLKVLLGSILTTLMLAAGGYYATRPRLQLDLASAYHQVVMFDSAGANYVEVTLLDLEHRCAMIAHNLGGPGLIWSEEVGARVFWYMTVRNTGFNAANNVRVGFQVSPSWGTVQAIPDPRTDAVVSLIEGTSSLRPTRVVAFQTPIPGRAARTVVMKHEFNEMAYEEFRTKGRGLKLLFVASDERGDRYRRRANPREIRSVVLDDNAIRFGDRSIRIEAEVSVFVDSSDYKAAAARTPKWLVRNSAPPCEMSRGGGV
jgi:hypothetical protein